MNVVYNHCYIIVNLNFIHPCNGFACNIESVLYVVRCLLPSAAHRPQSWLESVGDPEPDSNFVELYAVAGLRGVYIASTVVEGVYLIKVY